MDLVAGGHEEPLWPRPGRVVIARPETTFKELSQVIHMAFGRWAPDEHHHFILADGTFLTTHAASDEPHAAGSDPDAGPGSGSGSEADPGSDAAPRPSADRSAEVSLDDASTALSMIEPGSCFLYESDLEQRWQHLCTVSKQLVDPIAQFGIDPDGPTVTGSWGTVTDPYGRMWDEYQFDRGVPPEAPNPPLSDLPPLDPAWGIARSKRRSKDRPRSRPQRQEPTHPGAFRGLWHFRAVQALDAAIKNEDDKNVFTLLGLFDALVVAHRSAAGMKQLASTECPERRKLLLGIAERLEARGWDGDVQLARMVHIWLDGEPLGSRRPRPVEVDLDTLAAVLAIPVQDDRSWTLDVTTSQLIAPDRYPRGWLHPKDGPPTSSTSPDLIGITGFGPEYVEEDIRIVAEYQGFTLEEDIASESSLLIEERSLGRARAWLDEVGLRPV